MLSIKGEKGQSAAEYVMAAALVFGIAVMAYYGFYSLAEKFIDRIGLIFILPAP